MSSADLRRHPRLDFEGRAWCEHRDLTLYLPIGNLSAGGLFIQTGAPLTTGERLKVSFGNAEGEGEEEIVAKVEIVWAGKSRRGAGVGCKFTAFLSGEAAYNRLIERLQS